MELFEGERQLSSSLTAVPTPGHTPGHTSVAISSGAAKGFILGDVVLSPIDAEEPDFQNSFDWDHEIARTTRLRMLAQLSSDGSIVGGSHLPPPGLGRIVKDGTKSRWQPEPAGS
jgi:glyoxylase-like metal-dependent hydrolase (beta-lactamase superfamily II)